MEQSKVISGRYSKIVEDISVRNTFITTLFIGMLGIILGIALGSTLISLAIPIIVMCAYITITFLSKTDLPMTIIGDSYYYQGFIFTLTALMGSLISLGINEKVDMNAMVASFGSALVTTIIGLIARLFVNSFSIGAHTRRERLEDEIERALTKFSGQLEVLTSEVVTSINNVHVNTHSTLTETLQKYEDVNTSILDSQTRTSEESHSQISIAMGELATKISNIEVNPSAISQPIKQSMDVILNTLGNSEKKFIKLYEKFDANSIKLASQLNQSGTQINSFIEDLGEKIATSISTNNVQITGEIKLISQEMIKSISSLDVLKAKANGEVEAQLNALSRSIKELVTQLSDITSPIKTVSEKITQDIQIISDGIKGLDANIVLTTDSLVYLKDAKSSIGELFTNVVELNKELSLNINANKSAKMKVTAAADATEQSAAQLAEDISKVYTELTNQIERIRIVS